MIPIKYLLPSLLLLGGTVHKTFGQITYPDSCLTVGFYFQHNAQWDTVKTIKLQDKEIAHFFSGNDSLLNLYVWFKNNCDQDIAVASEILIDIDCSLEGYRISDDGIDTLQPNMAYDHVNPPSIIDYILKPGKIKQDKYPFSLGFDVSKKGSFKFRLRFLNGYNYIPVKDWKYYYSNWLYLTIE